MFIYIKHTGCQNDFNVHACVEGERVVRRVWFWTTSAAHAAAPAPPWLASLPAGERAAVLGAVAAAIEAEDGPGLSAEARAELRGRWGVGAQQADGLLAYCFAQARVCHQ